MTELNIAISLYLGRGASPFPKEDMGRLTTRFGPDQGARLAQEVRDLLGELDGIKPDWNKHDLVNGAKWAVAELRRAHPELNDDAIAALEWTYGWWWK